MKRVISVTTDRQPGGIATALIGYSRALNIAGYQHMVILPANASIRSDLAKEPNVEIKAVPLRWLNFHILTCFIFYPSVRASLPDACAILVHNARLLTSLSRLAIPHFLVNHSGKLRHLEKADSILFLSSAAKERAKTAFEKKGIAAADQPKCAILPHGFSRPAIQKKKAAEKDRQRNPEENPEGNPEKVPTIMAAGRFVEKKGFADLIDAAALLQHQNIACRIELYGTGPLEEAYRRQIDQLGLNNLALKGWAKDLSSCFASADMFCLPSHEEPFGLILGEAMLAGLPVIASRTDGPSDILGTGGTSAEATLSCGGLLYPPGEPEALAEALCLLIRDKKKRAAAALAGTKHITQQYSLAQQAKALDAILTAAKR